VTTVGLLECDHVSASRRDIAGDYADMFRAMFAAHVPAVDLVAFDVIGGAPLPALDACDAWLVPGSRHSVYDDDRPWIPPLAAFVRAAHAGGRPLAGVCFGHQMVAHALGGRVEPAPGGWGAGVAEVRLRPGAAEPWMDPPADRLALHFMHQDQVLALPPGGVALGGSDHCPVALLRVGSLVGVQAHPEFVPAYTDALLAARVAAIGDDEVAAARASLSRPTDEGTMARWLGRALGAPVSPAWAPPGPAAR